MTASGCALLPGLERTILPPCSPVLEVVQEAPRTMSSTAVANLYLKWLAFREIVGHPHSDAQIAGAIFGDNDGSVKFSKLLYGDYGCSGEVAAELVAIVNRRIESVRKARGLAGQEYRPMRVGDVTLPIYDFVQRLLDAVGTVEEEALDRAHGALVAELTTSLNAQSARLRIERYSKNRAFEGTVPSGGGGPIVFEPRSHLGKITIEGIVKPAAAAYVLFVRDPKATGARLWDLKWGDTVLWIPSPFTPTVRNGAIELMAEPQPVKPMAGRFVVIATAVLDRAVLGVLDPRGKDAPPAALDELETSRYLTNLRRIMKRRPEAVAVATDAYVVAVA